jgi:hypothetical protein
MAQAKEKSSAQLEKEASEAEKKAQKERAEVEADRAAQDARAAEAEADEAKEREKEAKAAAKGSSRGSGKLSKSDVDELVEDQIEHGKAPIAPGPEQPVDPDDAAKAKSNRGRGLGG